MFPFSNQVSGITFVMFVIFQNANTANILMVSVTPSLSHQKAFQPIWRELSLRGHNVHVVTPDPLKDPTLTNLTEYDLSSHYNLMKFAPQTEQEFLARKTGILEVFRKDIFMSYGFSMLHSFAFKHSEFQRLLNSNMKFDVVIAEWLLPTMGALGVKYNCPVIGMLSSGASLTAMDSVGNPSHPVTAPDHNLPLGRDMMFLERLVSVVYSVYVRFWHHFVTIPREDKLIRRFLGEDLPYMGDIEKNVSLLLLNRNSVFHRIKCTVPYGVIEIGGISLNRTKPPLDPELQEFLDNSKQGAIYFSLGSNLRMTNLHGGTMNVFLKVFEQLPYNVVMKWEHDVLQNKPSNVFFSSWFPQLTVLDHPNIKLFLTQGGLQSSEEAIFAEVPIIGFPMQNDQTANVDTFAKYGAGIILDIDNLTADKLNSSIYEVITNSSYKKNVKILSSLMYDQPIDGLQRAVWWIEYVIRHKGAKHFRSPILDVPWWQYFMMDMAGFLLTALTVILLAVYFVSKATYLLLKKYLYLVLRCISSNDKTKKIK